MIKWFIEGGRNLLLAGQDFILDKMQNSFRFKKN